MLNSKPTSNPSVENTINKKLGDLIKECKNEIFTKDFLASDKAKTEETELETLGIIISKYCEFIGTNIQTVALAAFEDSNYSDATVEID